MQRGELSGEVSSFVKKLHSQDDGVTSKPRDVEKAGVEGQHGSASGMPLAETNESTLNEKALKLEDNRALATKDEGPNSDQSTIANLDDKDDFPEGGLRAWLVVLGAFCGSFSVFGIINSTAVLLEYFSTHQLKDYNSSQIGWIFGLALFLTFFCGAPIGPIFDSYGPRALIAAGSVLLVLSMLLLGLCTQYWHFFLVYSVLNGLGGCLINTPCIASIGHFFLVKRGNATGIAMTSGSIGGIIFPLMLQKLFPTVGFPWAMRILGFLLAFLLLLANFLVRSRLPRKPMASLGSVAPSLWLFKDVPFALTTIGIFLMEWGIFVPLTYLTSYSTAHGHSTSFGFNIIAVFNAGSFFGRFFAGFAADIFGRMNTLIFSILLCVITCFALWLPAGSSTPMIVVFALTFGFVSGSNLSLSPVCVGQMCKTENYGRFYATAWMVVAFGTLTGLPIAGSILELCGGNYWGVITFAGLSYAGALNAAPSFAILAETLVKLKKG